MAHGSARQPAKHLQLYEFEACPYCRLVREALTELDIDALIHPSPHGGQRFRPKVARLGGKEQFPFLVDPNSGESMYESADIVRYLYRQYGGRRPPTRLLRPIDVSTSVLAGIPRLRAGAKARPSKAPRKPLELFSFESSPYSRRVRELLCELELPYLLRSTGKAGWRDLGPPVVRADVVPGPAGRGAHADGVARARRQGAGSLPRRPEYRGRDVRVGPDPPVPASDLRGVGTFAGRPCSWTSCSGLRASPIA